MAKDKSPVNLMQKGPEQESEQDISCSHPGVHYTFMCHTNYLWKRVESFENKLKLSRQRRKYQSAMKMPSGESKLENAYKHSRSFCKTRDWIENLRATASSAISKKRKHLEAIAAIARRSGHHGKRLKQFRE